MTHLRFCTMYAHWSKDEENTGRNNELGKMHAQKAMLELGIKYSHSTPQSMGDSWWFWNCSNTPEKLPGFLSILRLDPMEQIGLGLSADQAKAIKSFNTMNKEK